MTDRLPRGLCDKCAWLRRIVSSRDREFYLCGRSASDPRYPKYPVLPVVACDGFEPVVDSAATRPTGR